MKKIPKNFFIIIAIAFFSILFFLSSPKAVSAQYFTCTWDRFNTRCEDNYSTCASYGCQTSPCLGLDEDACYKTQACNCPNIGNYRCEYQPSFWFCSLNNYCATGCYEAPGACGAGCNSDSPWTACICVTNTPTPTTPVCRCRWMMDHCGILIGCPPGYVENCYKFTFSGACSDVGSCACLTPTPTSVDPIKDCQEKCTDPAHPFAQCLDTHGIDPPGCVNPPGLTDYNCLVNDLDCLCCAEPTIRQALNPLCGENAIYTSIGCIPVGDQNAFMTFILRWALGIAGGTSFILIIYSGFMIATSGGDKRKLESGKELLTAALSGLILIIFSVFILDLIGIRLLKIPGL